MEKIYSIYQATNILNGKSYIGFTGQKLDYRIKRHLGAARRGSNFKFHNALKIQGGINFVWQIIYQSKDKEHILNVMEPYFISLYGNYNIAKGGAGVLGVTKNSVWITNGKIQKRIIDENIPVGWYKGRLYTPRSVKMTDQTKKKISRANKTKLAGGNNPAAKRVICRGKTFETIRKAAAFYNTTAYLIKKDCCFL